MENKSLLNLTIKWGLITGIISIVYTLILYIAGPTLLAGGWVYLSLLIIIIMMSLGVAEKRREQGGSISLSEGLLTAFLIFFFSQFLSSIFTYLLYTVIDPELPAIIKEEVINNTYSMMEKFGLEEEEIEKQLSRISEEDFSPTIGKTILNFMIFCVLGLVLSLIVGAIMKRKRPVFEERHEG